MSDTQPLEVTYDETAAPTKIKYHHMTFGLMRLSVEDGVATLEEEWDRLGDKSLKEGYTRWVSTGDVLRSVEQLPFIERIDAPHHAPKGATECRGDPVADGEGHEGIRAHREGQR